MYAFLADLVVVIHCAYVGYVLLGQLAIWLGWALRWRWTRNLWFRATHLVAIGFVAFEEGIGMVCPLTDLEADLRTLAGESTRPGTFMGRIFHDVLFLDLPHSAFAWIHVGFAILVLTTFVLYPPKLPEWLRRPASRKAV